MGFDMDALSAIHVLALLPGVLDSEAQALWEDFEAEIANRNRYFPRSRVVDIFQALRPSLEFSLDTDKEIYRARKVEPPLLQEKIQCIMRDEDMKITPDSSPEAMNEAFRKIAEYMERRFPDSFFQKKSNYLGSDLEAWVKNRLGTGATSQLFEKDRFWGYNAEQSDAPQNSKSIGRANPPGIRYLYAAEDEYTAICEVRPDIGEYVSIAAIRPKRKLRIYNLQRSPDELKISDEGIGDEIDFMIHRFSKHFSLPVFGDESKYYATQYICEMIKTQLGFDGIRFQSAVDKNGTNIVLFDTADVDNQQLHEHENYEIIRSKLIRVKQLSYGIEPILPVEKDIKN